ncbi:15-hydroxyprostaglandin dehydrogenase [NAD(+)]-like isoform X2 [Nerophis lumbriciformis]|uniref:15-hydroxyprostaglandin dehydrogenase [NAD(+)]-like isoform X2 n=1 Tax=Nerophis lumbriciformis TaxID=546530 RepID=UPI002ADF41CE|nr:15-hydroxyprostaglandin dehydrogenase [NAD(+)]-like isoform X2 [Nerophis lumbriciformis]
MPVSGKVCVVTGAAGGIGKAISEVLFKNGAKVVLLDVDESAGRILMEALNKEDGKDRALFLSCDVQSEEQMKAALETTMKKFGRMDVLCNNAGVLNEDDFEKTVAINLVAVIRGTYLALQHMNKMAGGQGGVIVNISSMRSNLCQACPSTAPPRAPSTSSHEPWRISPPGWATACASTPFAPPWSRPTSSPGCRPRWVRSANWRDPRGKWSTSWVC